jgi:hypothetical protein
MTACEVILNVAGSCWKVSAGVGEPKDVKLQRGWRGIRVPDPIVERMYRP